MKGSDSILTTPLLLGIGLLLTVLGIGALSLCWRLSRPLVSPYPCASRQQRFLAGLFDLGVCLVCFAGLAVQDLRLAVVLSPLYLVLRDSLLPGQSLGKVVAGLVVVRLEDGRPAGLSQSLRRNLLFLVPGLNLGAAMFEAVVLCRDPQGMRLGDRLAHTQVVEGRALRQLIRQLRELLRDATKFEELETPRRSCRQDRAA